MTFTVVMPVHDEARMLPYTLRSIFSLKPGEVVAGIDRCTDLSEELIYDTAKATRTPLTLRRFTEEDGADWSYRPGYLRRELYADARHDTILNTSADIWLDPAITKHLPQVSRCGLVSLGYWDYPWNTQSITKRLISMALPFHGNAGLVAFSKRAWLNSENLEELRTQPRIMGEDTHLSHAIGKHYPTRHVNTDSLHLRPTETAAHHYKCGVVQWKLYRKSLPEAFIYSVGLLRPASMMGYIDARRTQR